MNYIAVLYLDDLASARVKLQKHYERHFSDISLYHHDDYQSLPLLELYVPMRWKKRSRHLLEFTEEPLISPLQVLAKVTIF